MQKWAAIFLTAVLLASLTACLKWPSGEVGSQPDRVLFERASSAMESKRYDVARMTFQTLVNTYPDSEYSAEARQKLLDICIGQRNGQWSPQAFDSSAGCEGI
jgi:outer membrane protein assembly factor BamD (BamD/ComL family)